MTKNEIDLAEAVQAVKDFSWWNYGLDEVSETQSDDWAKALAAEVAPVVLDAERKRVENQPHRAFSARELLGGDLADFMIAELREELGKTVDAATLDAVIEAVRFQIDAERV